MDGSLSNLETEKFRELWETLLLNNKINVCTEKLKGLNIIDVNVLKLLTKNPDIKLKYIAQKLNVPNSTLTHSITRLENVDLVKRIISPNDLRSFHLEITQTGNQAITEHRNGERNILKEMLKALNDEEKKIFLDLFEKLVNNI